MANENLMRLVREQSYAESFEQRRKKAEAISKACGGGNYAESNHMFIKTFFDVAVDAFGNDLRVVVLRRKIPLVVKSFVELEYFGQNAESYKWMTRSDAKTRAIDPIDAFDKLDIFDRTISYLIDIEARAQRFKQDYPEVQVHEVNIEDLNDLNKVVELFEFAGVSPKDTLESVVNVPVNQRHQRKKTFRRRVSFDQAATRVDKYLARAKQKGITVPESLYL
jgi:hypothetical protein